MTTTSSTPTEHPQPVVILGGPGKTGRRVAQRLTAAGVPVRLASRSSTPRFDWHDESTWTGVTTGARTAYLAPPVDPAGLSQAARFVRHAATEGLRRVVLLSGRGVGSPGRDFAVYRSSLELDQAVQASGLDWTILRPAWFMQNFSEDFLLDYARAGELRLSTGTGAEAWIDLDDLGDVAAAVLRDESHNGRIHTLSGPRALTLTEVAAELSTATGREIRYVDLDPADHVAELTGFGLPQEDAEALRDLFAVIRQHRSEYVSDEAIRAILGRAPRDFADWAAETARTGVWSV